MIQTSVGQTPIYECSSDKSHICQVYNANLTLSNKSLRLNPLGKNIEEITEFWFVDSKVKILTNDVCETLPHVAQYVAGVIGLSSIETNAFEKCTKLTSLSLWRNELESLPLGIFDFNLDLTSVNLNSNKLRKIDENLFKNNQKLEKVYLMTNFLSSFPPNLFKSAPGLEGLYLDKNQLTEFSFANEMPALKWLQLGRNKLSSLDVVPLLEKCPKIITFHIPHNDYSCDRQREIIEVMEAKKLFHGYFRKCVDVPNEYDHLSDSLFGLFAGLIGMN